MTLLQLQQRKINDTLNQNKTAWQFNTTSSPWIGGAMKTLLKTIKCLKAVFKDRTVSEETFLTYLVETESVINNRL